MVEREHTPDRGAVASEADQTVAVSVNGSTKAFRPSEEDLEYERQLNISRGVQHDFEEVLAVLSR